MAVSNIDENATDIDMDIDIDDIGGFSDLAGGGGRKEGRKSAVVVE